MTPDTSAPTSRRVNLAASLTTAALLVLMTLSGALYLVSPPPLLRALEPLGYPAYFLRLLGVAKLLGVAALLIPGRTLLREWAYAGFTFDLLAALASHLATGTATHAPPALFALVLVLASYRFAHRGGAPMDLFRRVER
ncbi:MAG TPA: DoxX family protein [Myxococcaceae bacterium]|nr:DoxX family protein [Myxococcaceae bacterium]